MNSPEGTVWGRIIYERESLPLGPVYTDRDLFVRALFFEMSMRGIRERILGMMSLREAIACAKEGASYKDEALSEFINEGQEARGDRQDAGGRDTEGLQDQAHPDAYAPISVHEEEEVIRTLGDRVVVRLDKGATKVGTIHIPEAVQKEETTTGMVVAVSEHGALSEEGKFTPPALKLGDRVFVKEWVGTEVILDDMDVGGEKMSGKFHVFRENDVLAVIED